MAQRRKLLRLYYDDKVGADLFAEEEARPLSVAIREAQRGSDDALVEVARADDVAQHFDESLSCSQRSTSTRHGRPPRTSSGAC